jgi:hypothetical protein
LLQDVNHAIVNGNWVVDEDFKWDQLDIWMKTGRKSHSSTRGTSWS